MFRRVRLIDVVTVALWVGCLVVSVINIVNGSPIPMVALLLGLAAVASTQVSLATWIVHKLRIDHAVNQLDELVARRQARD